MTGVFWLRVLLSFIVGGLYIAFVARMAERFGSRLGGILMALPTTLLVSLSFIAWTQPAVLRETTTVMPAAIATATIFLVAFVRFSKLGTVPAYFAALGVWAVVNLISLWIHGGNVLVSLFISFWVFLFSIWYFRGVPHRQVQKAQTGHRVLLLRVLFSGSFVALAVVFNKFAGPHWGGLLATFPAAFSATALIMHRAHGREFMASMSRTMVIGAAFNVVFVMAIYVLVPHTGNAVAIAIAYVLTIASGALGYRYLLRRL